MQVSHITLTFWQVFYMFWCISTLTHHVVPGRNDEFLLLVMSGSALLIVMLCSRNRLSCITERRRTTATSFVPKVRTSRCWIFLSFSVSWFFSAWMSGVTVTGCLGSRVLITCSHKKHFLLHGSMLCVRSHLLFHTFLFLVKTMDLLRENLDTSLFIPMKDA